jgi:uncharacterized protein YjbI with pentapeptide repeats
LEFIDFEGANLYAADFTGVSLRRCNLRKANLRKARFNGVDLKGNLVEGAIGLSF